jgi:serine/threonine-protein kinase
VLLARCLAKRPAARFQSTGDLAAALRALPAAPTEGMPAVPRAARGSWRSWLAAGLVLATAAALSLALRRPAAAPAATAPSTATLAVLPFTTDDANTYAAEGFAEGLRRSLAQFGGLRVIAPRRPDFEGRGAARLVQGAIAGTGADTAVEVSVTEGSDGRVLWRQSYAAAGNLHDLEGRIARDIGAAAGLGPGAPALATAPAYQPEAAAYRAYLKGRHHWNKFTPEGRRKALEHYQQAIDLDPAYALAYCGLADTFAMMGQYGEHPEETFPKARAAAQRAIEADPGLGEAYASYGTVLYMHDWKWRDAEEALRRGAALSPRYATAHHSLGVLLGLLGRFDASEAALATALELDPLSVVIRLDLAWTQHLRGDRAKALASVAAAQRQDPKAPLVYEELAWHLELAERFEESCDALRKAAELTGRPVAPAEAMRAAFRSGGARAYFRAKLAAERGAGALPSTLARTLVQVGETEEAFAQLEQALRARDSGVIYLKASPVFQDLRADPRFQALLARAGFP